MKTADSERSPSLLPVVLAGACAFLDLYVTQPLLPLFASIFHANKVRVSFTVTASTIGVALAAPFVGSVADQLGRRRVILWSAWALAASTLLAATSPNLDWLLFWRFLQGIVTPGVFAVTVAYINDEWPADAASYAVAAYVSGTVLGGFAGRVLAGLVAEHLGWRWVFVVLGLIVLSIAGILSLRLPTEKKFARASQSSALWRAAFEHLRNRRLLATYGVGFFILFTLVATFSYVNFHLAAPPFSLSTAWLGSVFFVYLLGALITPGSGKWIGRVGHRKGLLAASLLSVCGALLTLAPMLWIVMAGLALSCSGVFISQSATNSYIGKVALHHRALAVGLYVSFYYAGGSFGATLPGTIWNWAGWPGCVCLVILAQFTVMGIAILGWPPD